MLDNTVLQAVAAVFGLESTTAALWVLIGFIGQVLFFGRFFIQWLASEKAGKSVIPLAFWYFSIGGGMILLAYALYQKDPVFIFGQASGLLIYLRNLVLIRRDNANAKSN